MVLSCICLILRPSRKEGSCQIPIKTTTVLLLHSLSLCHQVIYKRFNIACPLEVFGNSSVTTAIPEDSCTAKFFTINQEVKETSQNFYKNY